MTDRVVLLAIPQLRTRDITPGGLSSLERLTSHGELAPLIPPFPGVAASAFATLITGLEPYEHGLIGNHYRDETTRRIVKAPLPDAAIHAPKLWHLVREDRPAARVMLWFAPNSEGAEVDLNAHYEADRQLRAAPPELGPRLLAALGDAPFGRVAMPEQQSFFETSRWILRSAGLVIAEEQPDLAVVRVPYLGQVARRFGPEGREAFRSVSELETILAPFLEGLPPGTATLAVTESIATPVTDVIYPNRVLRDLGLLATRERPDGSEEVDIEASDAYALADHQICHIYINDPTRIGLVASTFSGTKSDGIAMVIASDEQRSMLGLDNERSGDVVLVACPDTWFAADWWLDPRWAPAFDSDPTLPIGATPTTPIDAEHVLGSLGGPPPNESYLGVAVSSLPGVLRHREDRPLPATEIVPIVRRMFG